MLKSLRKLRRNSVNAARQKWNSVRNWLLKVFLAITTFFKLRDVKDPEVAVDIPIEQTTPKCNQSQLLARLDAIHMNPMNGSALDDSSDSALGVAPHLPDEQRTEFQEVAESSNIYSSTPIIHGGLSFRRSRLQTPNSPM